MCTGLLQLSWLLQYFVVLFVLPEVDIPEVKIAQLNVFPFCKVNNFNKMINTNFSFLLKKNKNTLRDLAFPHILHGCIQYPTALSI